MGCVGVCVRYKFTESRGRTYYSKECPNRKFCAVCQEKIEWDNVKCPCCGTKMRGKPRNIKNSVFVPMIVN